MEQQGTLYIEMKKVDGDTWVKAYHVCPAVKAELIKKNLTAGGEIGAKADAGAPTEKECVKQVEFERAPWAPPSATPRVVVEFGVGQAPGYNGRAGDVIAVFQIQAKYLRWGSGTEGGWCAYPKVPIKWVGLGADK